MCRQRFFEEDKIICLIVTLPRVLHGILEVGVNTADFAAGGPVQILKYSSR